MKQDDSGQPNAFSKYGRSKLKAFGYNQQQVPFCSCSRVLEGFVISGRNMSIIPIVDKIRSLSIQIKGQISEIDKSRSHNSCDYRLCSIMIDLIDFDRFQSTNTKSEIQ